MERNRAFSPESIQIRGMLDRGISCVLRAMSIPTHVTRLEFKGVYVMEKAPGNLRSGWSLLRLGYEVELAGLASQPTEAAGVSRSL